MSRILIIFLWLFVVVHGVVVDEDDEKVIQVPTQMTVEVILSDSQGLLNGTYDIRARIYDPISLERIWYEDFEGYPIRNGAFVLVMNSDAAIPVYHLHRKSLMFVLTVGMQSVEIPLLTDFYSYRSLFAEFGWGIRFPSLFYVDRDTDYLGIGNRYPKGHVDVGGGLKLSYEETEVTGAIRWVDNTLKIRHPDAWVDLLYGPTNFKRSRWQNNAENIELVSANYKVGIGKDHVQKTLDVEGSGYFSGHLRRATSLTADSFSINSMQLSSSQGLSIEGDIFLIDGDENDRQSMVWTDENLTVVYGQIEGDGSQLVDVGQGADAFKPGVVIQSRHVGNQPIIEQRHFKNGSVLERHIADDTITMDRFNHDMPVFHSETIGDDSISSDNIMAESLTFDILITNNITEYIPNDFFTHDKVATNSIYSNHIENRGIASYNIQLGIFGKDQLATDVLNATHVTDNAVLISKIKDGEITSSLFSGRLQFLNGGTGVASLTPRRVLSLGDAGFDSDTTMVVSFSDSSMGHIGILDRSVDDFDLTSPLTLGSVAGDSHMILQEDELDPLMFNFMHATSTMNFSLLSSGQFLFDMSNGQNQSLVFHPMVGGYGGVSFDIDSLVGYGGAQNQWDVGRAITIGNSEQDHPSLPGVLEYDSGRSGVLGLRFWHGDGERCSNGQLDNCGWRALQLGTTAIGDPSSMGHTVVIKDSFVGSLNNSAGAISSSMLGDAVSSNVHGQLLTLDRVVDSNVRGTSIHVDFISDASIDSYNLYGQRVRSSTLNVDQGTFKTVDHSIVSGQRVHADHVRAADLHVNQVLMRNVDHLNGLSTSVYLDDVTHSTIDLSNSYVSHAHSSQLDGVNQSIFDLQFSDISGTGNAVEQSAHIVLRGASNYSVNGLNSVINGRNNALVYSSNSLIYGNDNRLFGSDYKVNGHQNVGLGHGAFVSGDQNIVINASNEILHVSGNSKVVLAAPNGVFIHTGEGMVIAATDQSGGWAMVSDRDLKTRFLDVDYQQMHQKLMGLNISKWEYIFNQGVKHIGPMAQDFNSLFNIGEDERFITSTDADGVAFSAVKYLISETDELRQARSNGFELDVDAFDEMFDSIDNNLKQLEISIKMKGDALKVMGKNNLEQYQILDKQFKVMSRFGDAPTVLDLIFEGVKLMGVFLFGLMLGFYLLRMYHNKVNK